MVEYVNTMFPFSTELTEAERERLVSAMSERRVNAGEVVIREGEEGDYFFAIDTGRFVVTKGGETKFVYDGSGETFLLLIRYFSSSNPTYLPSLSWFYYMQVPLVSWRCCTRAPAQRQ